VLSTRPAVRANPFHQDGTLSMTSRKPHIIAGVDTHSRTHHAAALNATTGQLLADQQFPATPTGYQQLLDWLRTHGRPTKIGVEGTGSYGAGLTRHLTSQQITVIEVDRPDRKTRRRNGKTDPIDAINAARAVLSGQATGTPKTRTGPVEAIRALRVARTSAIKARTAATNQLHALITTAPETLRTSLRGLTTAKLVTACAQLEPDPDRLGDPTQATSHALASIARRVQALTAEITALDRHLKPLVTTTAPQLSAVFGVGPETAGQLLSTAGDNPDRLRSEAALAHLTGTAPLPASSGQTHRHRLNRGGDRHANHALHTIALVRLRHHQPTRDYAQRRTTEGLTKKDILRCLKRNLIREIYTALLADYTALNS
jgi:transposase